MFGFLFSLFYVYIPQKQKEEAASLDQTGNLTGSTPQQSGRIRIVYWPMAQIDNDTHGRQTLEAAERTTQNKCALQMVKKAQQ